MLLPICSNRCRRQLAFSERLIHLPSLDGSDLILMASGARRQRHASEETAITLSLSLSLSLCFFSDNFFFDLLSCIFFFMGGRKRYQLPFFSHPPTPPPTHPLLH